jgi:hypothetical protein
VLSPIDEICSPQLGSASVKPDGAEAVRGWVGPGG